MRVILVRNKPIGGRKAPEVKRLENFCERHNIGITIWDDGSEEASALKILSERHFGHRKNSGILPLFVLFDDYIVEKVVWACYNPRLKALREVFARLVPTSEEHPVG